MDGTGSRGEPQRLDPRMSYDRGLDLHGPCASFRAVRRIQPVIGVLTLLLMLSGCRTIVGDACETGLDCSDGLECELTLPDGYCTRSHCDTLGCPDEGICVAFDDHTSYCMDPCAEDAECRDDYVCVREFGPHPFCHAASSLVDRES